MWLGQEWLIVGAFCVAELMHKNNIYKKKKRGVAIIIKKMTNQQFKTRLRLSS